MMQYRRDNGMESSGEIKEYQSGCGPKKERRIEETPHSSVRAGEKQAGSSRTVSSFFFWMIELLQRNEK
jgi:hypothetical protein